ncbi:MAG: YhcH/YjgK/YiaL family protein [Bacteroidales bacterium]
MILDSIVNSAAYESLHPSFKKAFDYIKANDFTKTAPTKICLEEDKLYVIIAETNGKLPDQAPLESHRKFIDIQIPIVGTETMGWISKSTCKKEKAPHNDEKDITFYEDKPTSFIDVVNGNFAIFFPEDAHAPGIGDGFIKKIIIKISVV